MFDAMLPDMPEDRPASKSAEQVADAVSGTEMETIFGEMVRDFTEVGSRPKSEIRRRILEYASMSSQTASAASPVAGVSGLDAEISEAKKEFIATFDAYRKAQKAWRHLVKRMYYECGATKADEFIRRVESGEHDVPSPWLAQPSAEGDGWIAGVEKIAHWLEHDSGVLMPIIVGETKHDHGVRLLKAIAGELRCKFTPPSVQEESK